MPRGVESGRRFGVKSGLEPGRRRRSRCALVAFGLDQWLIRISWIESEIDHGGKPFHDASKPLRDGGEPLRDGGESFHDAGKPLHDGGKPLHVVAVELDVGACLRL